MPDQAENHAVVGEDGELLQPDITVDPNAYTEFVATYVHRDPLSFRVREHYKEWRLLYSFLSLLLCCPTYVMIPLIFGQGINGTECLNILLITAILIGACVSVFHFLSRIDVRQ